MLKHLLYFLFLFFSFSVFSQVDSKNGNSEKGKTKVVIMGKAKEVEKPKALEPEGNEGFKNARKNELQKLKEKEEEKKNNEKDILTQEQLNNLRIKEMYGLRKIPKVDSPQGKFLTISKSVVISVRDFGSIDGDIITIYHNGIEVIPKIVLDGNYQSFNIFLEKGENFIDILAVNQGDLGANTAQYKLSNGEGNTLSSNYWFLATGAKATFNITKN